MSKFVDYLVLTPLINEAANLISLDLAKAIISCNNLSKKDQNKSYVYEAIANKLCEVDYKASFNKTQAAISAQQKAAAIKDAENKKIINAEIERARKEAEAKKPAPSAYGVDSSELVRMLKHIGNELMVQHHAGKISQDYAGAIHAIIMDLNSSIRRQSLPNDPDERAAAIAKQTGQARQRHDAATKGMGEKNAAGRRYSELMEIVKTLRDNGLPTWVTDEAAAATYEKLYELTLKIHRAGGDIRKTLLHWLNNAELGDEHATEEELQVINAVLHLGSLVSPGSHKHEPVAKNEPEANDDLAVNDEPLVFNPKKINYSALDPKDDVKSLKNAVMMSVESGNYDKIKNDLNFVLEYFVKFLADKTNNLKRFINSLFEGKTVIGKESVDTNVIEKIEHLKEMIDDEGLDQLKNTITVVLSKLHKSKINYENNLHESNNWFIMLKTLAGVKN